MDIRHRDSESKNSPIPTNSLPSLAKRSALASTEHPGRFALEIWTVERCPSGGQVASIYRLAGRTP